MKIRQTAFATFLSIVTVTTAAFAAGWSGMDSSFVAFKNIDSTNPAAPTVVNTVVVVCPSSGILVSTASAQVTMATSNGQAGEADVQYGISKNSAAADINQHHLLRAYSDSGTIFGTASYQRVDACSARQRVTMRLVMHRLSAETASAEKSSLVVIFFEGVRI